MVARNSTDRHEPAERDEVSPWSEDQATTCYMPEELHALPGTVHGLPPLPSRFQEPQPPAADGGGEWLDLVTDWDGAPPRASGMARRSLPRMAANEAHASDSSDWCDELEQQLRAARAQTRAFLNEREPADWAPPEAAASRSGAYASAAHAAWDGDAERDQQAHVPAARTGGRDPVTHAAWAVDARSYGAHDPEEHAYSAPEPLAQDPWQDEPDYQSPRARAYADSAHARRAVPTRRSRQRHAIAPPAAPVVLQPTAASTQRQRPQRTRTPSSPELRPATSQHVVPALPPRAAQDTRQLGRGSHATRTMRTRPAPTRAQYSYDDISENPFAPRRPRRNVLFAPLLACAAGGALYFGAQLPRLAGWLQPEQTPVLRSTPLPPLQAAAPAAPPPAAEPTPAAPSSDMAAPMLAAAPRRTSGSHARKGDDALSDDSPRARSRGGAHAVQLDDVASRGAQEGDGADDSARAISRRGADSARTHAHGDSLDADPSSEDAPSRRALQPTEAATLRINSRPWAQIFVDGMPMGNTPQLRMSINAGHHTIRLVNPELEVSKTFELDAHPGETLSRVELLSDS